jgi:hypothetical protein
MNMMPATINVATARLPQAYESAKAALANCASIDECKDWANKAEALASYARQSEDDSLRKMADRIQARAVRRCGELLKQFDGQGQRTDKLMDGAVHKFTQKEAAQSAGMSERQVKTAVRVANVPTDAFESAVESDAPPTVTALAEIGKHSRLPEPPDGFREATRLLGSVRRFAEFCAENDPLFVAGGVLPKEASDLRKKVSIIDGWLDKFVTNLKGP